MEGGRWTRPYNWLLMRKVEEAFKAGDPAAGLDAAEAAAAINPRDPMAWGYLCEAAYHHADLAITWGKLWVKLKTHSAGGITDKDFDLARKIEEVVLWRPQGGALGTGNPKPFVFSKT